MKMQTKQTQTLTQGRIFVPLIRFSLPVLLALMLQTTYGAVDLLVVGQFGSAADVSAVSTGGHVMHTVTMLITGLAMGLTVLVGRRIGEGRRQEAGRIIGSGIVLFGAMAVVVSVVMVFLSPAVAGVMHAPPEAFDKAAAYIRICSAGTVFIVAYNLVGSVFRGLGDSNMPLISVSIACVFNVAGDLLLAAGLHMGTVGVAIATVAAQALSVLISLLIIRRRELPFVLTLRDVRPNGSHFRQILRLGIPISLMDLLVNVSFLVINAIINGLGVIVSAGVGVAGKLVGFVMLVPSSFMQSMSAFVAQNMGAGRPDRAQRALRYCILTSLAAGVVIFWAGFFHGDACSSLFARDPQVVAAAAEYLKAYAIDCLITAFLFSFTGYFNGCGKTVFVMIQGIVGAFLVRIPVSYLMSLQTPPSLFRIGLATPASSFVQILLCLCYFAWLRKKETRQKLSPAE